MNSLRHLGLALWCCAFVAGCGGNSTDDYVQSGESARAALEAALNSWKSGAPLGTVKSGENEVDAFDSRWRDGQRLENFTIVEELPGDPHVKFRVTLRLADALEDEECTYVVMGIDPILVFRDEDYESATGM